METVKLMEPFKNAYYLTVPTRNNLILQFAALHYRNFSVYLRKSHSGWQKKCRKNLKVIS